MDEPNDRLDLAAIRARLAAAHGPHSWRSLEELADSQGFRECLQREFPGQASPWLDPVGRRDVLRVMGASLALAGLGGCGSPAPPSEEVVPGKPLFFATAVTLGGFATGVLVESHEGRPTKIEGNPQHPASLGATDVFTQAAILTLYDPDRSQVVTNAGRISPWNACFNALNAELETQRLRRGAGLRILSETVTSPTLAGQLRGLLARFPEARWHQYEPAGRDAGRAGARLAFGEFVDVRYRLDRADVILALDADVLGSGPGCVRYARDFAARRRVRAGRSAMNRLYAVESTPTVTGAMADHRLPLRPSDVIAFARALAQRLGVDLGPGATGAPPAVPAAWLAAVARDLQRHRGEGLVLAGEQQPPAVHALAHAMNSALGNAGESVEYTDPVEAHPGDQLDSLRELVVALEAGLVDLLVIIGGNPVYTAPADLRFAERLSPVGLRVHLSLYQDETSALCHWHVPAAHELEAWSDARADDGTVTILQPLIAPLYNGKSAHELLAGIRGRVVRAPAWIVPGQADECVTVHLGYGRTRAGRVGTGLGLNAYALRPADAPWGGPGLQVRKAGGRYSLACTQFHHHKEGRDLARSAPLAHYLQQPEFARDAQEAGPAGPTLYPAHRYDGYAWGMAIDLNACTGCSACIVACQAENNIPVVGKAQVERGREMHWLRIDRYYQGPLDQPRAIQQPVPCMHCENAPCELVCPVGATVHSAEGLNDMVSNRVVGTRYCSNNCPYKVRRFNFLQFADYDTPSLKLQRNPNVTIRSRGVMEKCTYCVQRINVARIAAQKAEREIRDGEIVTACQAARPTEAIVFGNINDPTSRVSRLKAEPLNYALLAELNTRPRTTYLARLRHPNPELGTA